MSPRAQHDQMGAPADPLCETRDCPMKRDVEMTFGCSGVRPGQSAELNAVADANELARALPSGAPQSSGSGSRATQVSGARPVVLSRWALRRSGLPMGVECPI